MLLCQGLASAPTVRNLNLARNKVTRQLWSKSTGVRGVDRCKVSQVSLTAERVRAQVAAAGCEAIAQLIRGQFSTRGDTGARGGVTACTHV